MTTHLTFALYRLIVAGHLPASVLATVGHAHLTETCEICRAEWAVSQKKGVAHLPLSPSFPASPPLEALPANDRHVSYQSLQQRLRRQERRRQQGRRARRHLAVLRSVNPELRADHVVKARSRYRSRAFAELLIEESRRLVRSNPTEAENLASLVPTVLRCIPGAAGQPWAFELAVRAQAWRANSQNAAGDLATASRTFASLHREPGVRQLHPGTLAELASLEASLRMAQGNFPVALAKLNEALDYSHLASASPADEVRHLLKMANLLVMMERPEDALVYLDHAEELMNAGQRDPQQDLSLLSSRVAVLCALGREGEVEEQFTAFRARHTGTDALTDAIVEGLRSRVKLHRGDAVGAARGLLEVQQAFLAADHPYDAALVSLDIALVYLESGQLQELERLAADLVPQFQARGVERETLAALRLLVEAVKRREVTRELLGRLRERIRPADQQGGGDG